MKRKWKIVAAAALMLVLGTATFAAAAGTEGDPLITLSYLKNVFTGQVQTMIDTAVTDGKETLKGQLDQAITDWDAAVSQSVADAEAAVGQSEAAIYETVTVEGNQTLVTQPGCEFILRSGNAIVSAADQALADTTAGTAVNKGGKLTANHHYLSVGTGSIVGPVTAGAQTGTVNAGPLNVRSGPGSSNSAIGQLQEGDIVTILGVENGWYKISTGSLNGYVSGDYVTLNPTTTVAAGPFTVMIRGSYTIE